MREEGGHVGGRGPEDGALYWLGFAGCAAWGLCVEGCGRCGVEGGEGIGWGGGGCDVD